LFPQFPRAALLLLDYSGLVFLLSFLSSFSLGWAPSFCDTVGSDSRFLVKFSSMITANQFPSPFGAAAAYLSCFVLFSFRSRFVGSTLLRSFEQARRWASFLDLPLELFRTLWRQPNEFLSGIRWLSMIWPFNQYLPLPSFWGPSSLM